MGNKTKSYYVSAKQAVEAKTNGDVMNDVIERNMGTVTHLVRKMRFNDRIFREDMMYEGRFAIISAIQKFDPEKSDNFNAYMWSYVRGYLLNLVKDKYYKNTSSANVKIFGEESAATRIDMIEAETDTGRSELLADILHKAKTNLTEKELDVFLRHSGVVGRPETFEEIGKSYGHSKMAICKTFKKAKLKMQKCVEK